jgi:hypothetical protein
VTWVLTLARGLLHCESCGAPMRPHAEIVEHVETGLSLCRTCADITWEIDYVPSGRYAAAVSNGGTSKTRGDAA